MKLGEHYIKFLEAREDTAESFKPPEQSLDFVTPPVHNLVVFPRLNPVGLGLDYQSDFPDKKGYLQPTNYCKMILI